MSIITRIFGESGKPRSRPARPDAAMQRVLDQYARLDPKPIETLTPQEARLQPTPADAVKKLLGSKRESEDPTLGVMTRDITIPGAAGPLQARVYRPKSAHPDVKPVVLYFHGGGFVIADLDVYDASPRSVARFADCVVVSVHYRQAPEHRFPAAHEDALAAWRWIIDNAASLGGDPNKIAIMGESAGGNLACATAIAARDAGLQAPCHMVLVYPIAGDDMETPSYIENATARPLNKPMMEWFVRHAFDDPSRTADPRINLVEADLIGLPSATVICAEIDPLRSEGELLAERLEQSGVEVRHKTFHGSTHEFFGMGLVVPDAAAAETFAAHELKRAFGTAVLPI